MQLIYISYLTKNKTGAKWAKTFESFVEVIWFIVGTWQRKKHQMHHFVFTFKLETWFFWCILIHRAHLWTMNNEFESPTVAVLSLCPCLLRLSFLWNICKCSRRNPPNRERPVNSFPKWLIYMSPMTHHAISNYNLYCGLFLVLLKIALSVIIYRFK